MIYFDELQVRDLAAMLPDEHKAGDLIEATRKLCGAFGNFLDKVFFLGFNH